VIRASTIATTAAGSTRQLQIRICGSPPHVIQVGPAYADHRIDIEEGEWIPVPWGTPRSVVEIDLLDPVLEHVVAEVRPLRTGIRINRVSLVAGDR
jgi:hypothetical protein